MMRDQFRRCTRKGGADSITKQKIWRFPLKKIGTVEHVGGLTTKYHDEESLGALLRLGWLRLTRGRQLAALLVTPAVGLSQAAAVRATKDNRAGDRGR